MTLTPEIIVLVLLDSIFLLLSIVAFALSFKIGLKWNLESDSSAQYTLEKQSYLVSIIIKYIFILKLPLFLFFIYTCDTLSTIITGAMCAAGVVNSVDYGLYLIVFKILNLYLFGFWLLLNKEDMKHIDRPYTRLKFLVFLGFFFPLMMEIILEIMFFASLNISKIVSCCGTLFSATSTSYLSLLFSVDPMLLLILFYGTYGVLLLGAKVRESYLFIGANIFFLIISIVSLIVFFSPYVYELPTHHCPFCLLQTDYYGIGYAMYIFLFVGTFYGIAGVLIERMVHVNRQTYSVSVIFNTCYCVTVSSYPIVYYIRNGVWL